MGNSTRRLREVQEALRAQNPRLSVDEVVKVAIERYPDDFNEDAEQHKWASARRKTRAIFRSIEAADDEDGPEQMQLALPGIKPPAMFYVPQGDYYVETEQATFPEVEGRLEELDLNIKRARGRRKDWFEKVQYLRPRMPNETITVAEACDPDWAKKEGA